MGTYGSLSEKLLGVENYVGFGFLMNIISTTLYINKEKTRPKHGRPETYKDRFCPPGTLEAVPSPHTLPHIARKTSYLYQYI